MAPMFVSEEKAAAALGIPQEDFEREVVARGLLQEFRDRNRKMYRYYEVEEYLKSLPLSENEFSQRLAELKSREGPKPDERRFLMRGEVERVLTLRPGRITELVDQGVLSRFSLGREELYDAQNVKSLIPTCNPRAGLELFTKMIRSSASTSIAKPPPEAELSDEDFLSICLDDDTKKPTDTDSLNDSGISIFSAIDDEEDDPNAITSVALTPLLEDRDVGLLDLSIALEPEESPGVIALGEDFNEPEPPRAAIERSKESDGVLLAEWKRHAEECVDGSSPLANLVMRLERSSSAESSAARKKVLEAFAERFDRIFAECSSKCPQAFVRAWADSSPSSDGKQPPRGWLHALQLKLASQGAAERLAKAEIENAVRHASSRSRELVKGHFALKLYEALY